MTKMLRSAREEKMRKGSWRRKKSSSWHSSWSRLMSAWRFNFQTSAMLHPQPSVISSEECAPSLLSSLLSSEEAIKLLENFFSHPLVYFVPQWLDSKHCRVRTEQLPRERKISRSRGKAIGWRGELAWGNEISVQNLITFTLLKLLKAFRGKIYLNLIFCAFFLSPRRKTRSEHDSQHVNCQSRVSYKTPR